MQYSRRNSLRVLGAGLLTGLAGCGSFRFGGRQAYAPVVLANDHDAARMISVAVTSIPEPGGGFSKFFSDVYLVDSGDEHEFEEGLAVPDSEPELMVLVVLDDGTSKRAEFRFDADLGELRIVVADDNQIRVEPRTSQ